MKKIMCFVLLASLFSGCKKFLEATSDKQLVVPQTLQDAQALLDSYGRMNNSYPTSGSLSDDDFYLADTYYNTMTTANQNLYTWNKEALIDNEWGTVYTNVLYANIALETIDKITPALNTDALRRQLKGAGLFFRSYSFYHLAQYFAVPYIKGTAEKGIPLRLRSDINIPTVRASLEDTYRRITDDLTEASLLLPVTVTPVSRPSRAAAFSALARVYLIMGEYEATRKYADSSLQLNSTLLNYNSLDPNAAAPFTRFNREVIFPSTVQVAGALSVTNWRVDTVLYQTYPPNDLRKKLFFRTNGSGAATYYTFKGSYDGTTSGSVFNGLTVAEMYLTRAECYARQGKITEAMNDLNALLITRWKTGTYIPFSAISADDALAKVLLERRKELVARGLRWFDLRRLNPDPRFAKTLTRQISGVQYQLAPNDTRYTFYIPSAVIALTGIEQNKR